MDREPMAPPFPVGARLRYTGDLRVTGEDGTTLVAPGMLGTVVEVRPGRRGTLHWIDLDDGGYPVQDTTRDGYSVVLTDGGWRRVAPPESWHAAHSPDGRKEG